MKNFQLVMRLNIISLGSNISNYLQNCLKYFWVKYYFKRGINFKDKGNLLKAISCFKKILEIDSRSADALNNIGVCYFEMGNYKEALGYFGKACVFKNDTDIIVNAIVASVHAGKKSIANYYCNKLEGFKNFIDTHTYLYLATLMAQIKYFEKAVYFYDLCIKRGGSDKLKAVHGKGICLAKQNKFEEALACVKILLSEDSGKKMGWELKGFILDLKGRYAEAVDCYNKAYGFE